MKALLHILLFIFLTSLAAPTLVSLLADEDDEITMVCAQGEEETQKDIKEVKLFPQWVYEAAFVTVVRKSTFIKSENRCKHESVSTDVFVLPPECC